MEKTEIKIIQFGHPTLRVVSKLVDIDRINGPEVKAVINDLKMGIPEHGIGLAAPQVNRPIRIFLADVFRINWEDDATAPLICVNPEIIESSNEESSDWEGCLSAPGFWGKVSRPKRIKVKFYSESGELITAELNGVGARVFQHELDHLDGVLYVDRMKDMTTLVTDEEFEKLDDRK